MQLRITRLLGMLLFLLTMMVRVGSASADFSGLYDPVNWTLTSLGNGSVDFSGAPNSIVLFSSNTGVTSSINTDYTAVAVGTGTVQFDWDFATSDALDTFGYLLNGTFFQLTTVASTGSTSFPVNLGDVFGFRINSDNVNGPSSATISSFAAPVPEPSAAALLALGLGVLGCAARRCKPSPC